MMKYLIFFISSLISVAAFSQQVSYDSWKSDAKEDIRLLPEYGHVPKTKGQIDADNEFIQTELKQQSDRRKASDKLIKIGFDYLYQGNLKTAMYRFNQAYLLDPKNENIYWGYGAIYWSFNDFDSAMAQYEKGLAINPNNPVILTDKATIYFVKFQQEQGKDIGKLNTAINLLQKSYRIDSTDQNTLYKLSICYFLKSDCNNAQRYYNECMKLGGKPITAEYTNALKAQCGK